MTTTMENTLLDLNQEWHNRKKKKKKTKTGMWLETLGFEPTKNDDDDDDDDDVKLSVFFGNCINQNCGIETTSNGNSLDKLDLKWVEREHPQMPLRHRRVCLPIGYRIPSSGLRHHSPYIKMKTHPEIIVG